MASVASPVRRGLAARPQAFGKGGVLAMVLFGTIAFIAFLYLIGAGQLTGPANNGQAHAASNGLTGYAGLVRLLEGEDHDVSVSRSEAAFDDYALLVLTPPAMMDQEELASIIENRRWQGPTLVILPKWYAGRSNNDEAKSGWVQILGAQSPLWNTVVAEQEIEVDLVNGEELKSRGWSATGNDALDGKLPESEAMQFFTSESAKGSLALVKSGNALLAATFERASETASNEASAPQVVASDDVGYYDEDGNFQSYDTEAEDYYYDEAGTYVPADEDQWPVTIVAEPDLMNNWGMADASRAQMAHRIIDAAADDVDLPVVFDLTLNGLGSSRNLLSLAFEPPFLAATLCLIMALFLVGWRAFRRFGPALVESQAFAFGKGQLVENGAGVIQRTGRMQLLTRPYAAQMEARIARKLGLRRTDRAAIDETLEKRGLEPLSPLLVALEKARHSHDIIRASRALHSLERTISR
ncbi:DUF4350 domain-containing protein [Parerythrobacter aestuarii]|uniref:DUF4350 domain-containing protein n=1 Tax=Parerythrobacter aestuarii TaxID=3020909 RepID=UPI0024DE5C8E|nr:DUF4350 domain-containing protein [Parerythrobacter aestuarii]